ncbi:MAG: hypothetical protein AAB446_01055 [Patescibacteria group bacterium]
MANLDVEKIIKRVQNESDKKMKEYMERYVGSLQEHTNDRFKIIKEGMDGINQRLDSHTEMISSLAEDITEIKNGMRQKVERYEFEALTKRVSVVERKITH